MKRLLFAIAYLKAFFSTLEYARCASPERRQKTAQLIMRLAELRGWDVFASDRCEYSLATVDKAPPVAGVYHIYDGDELVYVGAVCRKGGLRERLKDHLKDKKSNSDLADFVAAGEASVEWYACQAPGWMEDYELTEYKKQYRRLPRFNKIQSGMTFNWWW
jgi:hypothetical protein